MCGQRGDVWTRFYIFRPATVATPPGLRLVWLLALSIQPLCLPKRSIKKTLGTTAAESSNERVLADKHWLTRRTVNEFPGQGQDQERLVGSGTVRREEFITRCWESRVQAPRMTGTENQNNDLASPRSPIASPLL